ncbi:basic proline-rich protein-like [Rhinolophus ferrumequinum]|uniref:basic proline-rich protein-like n=1 Tax=Rhinolophus ferrumequinum TaxID=59479 RepID=UPI00140F5AE8|nr:basic proline-rich protein-like [Rhinolophus ferrumequinum]
MDGTRVQPPGLAREPPGSRRPPGSPGALAPGSAQRLQESRTPPGGPGPHSLSRPGGHWVPAHCGMDLGLATWLRPVAAGALSPAKQLPEPCLLPGRQGAPTPPRPTLGAAWDTPTARGARAPSPSSDQRLPDGGQPYRLGNLESRHLIRPRGTWNISPGWEFCCPAPRFVPATVGPSPDWHCHQSMVAKALASCSEPQPQGTHIPLRGPKVPLCGSNRLPRGLRPYQGAQPVGCRDPHSPIDRAPPPVLARRPPGLRQPPGVSGDSPLGATPQLRGPSPHRNDKGLATRLDPVTARAPPPAWGTGPSLPKLARLTPGPHPSTWPCECQGPAPGSAWWPALLPKGRHQSPLNDTGARDPAPNLSRRRPGPRPLSTGPKILTPARPGGHWYLFTQEGPPQLCDAAAGYPPPLRGNPKPHPPSSAQRPLGPQPLIGRVLGLCPPSLPGLRAGPILNRGSRVPSKLDTAAAWAPPTTKGAQEPAPRQIRPPWSPGAPLMGSVLWPPARSVGRQRSAFRRDWGPGDPWLCSPAQPSCHGGHSHPGELMALPPS